MGRAKARSRSSIEHQLQPTTKQPTTQSDIEKQRALQVIPKVHMPSLPPEKVHSRQENWKDRENSVTIQPKTIRIDSTLNNENALGNVKQGGQPDHVLRFQEGNLSVPFDSKGVSSKGISHFVFGWSGARHLWPSRSEVGTLFQNFAQVCLDHGSKPTASAVHRAVKYKMHPFPLSLFLSVFPVSAAKKWLPNAAPP